MTDIEFKVFDERGGREYEFSEGCRFALIRGNEMNIGEYAGDGTWTRRLTVDQISEALDWLDGYQKEPPKVRPEDVKERQRWSGLVGRSHVTLEESEGGWTNIKTRKWYPFEEPFLMTPKEQPKHGETWMCLILSSGEHREMEYLGDVEWVGRDKDGEVYACHTEHLEYMWRKV